MKAHSITRRIGAWFAALLSTVLLALGAYLYRSLDEHFLQGDTTMLLRKIDLVRHILSDLRSIDEIGTSLPRFRNVIVGDQGLFLQIQSEAGETLFASLPVPIPESAWGGTSNSGTIQPTTTSWSPRPDVHFRLASVWSEAGQAPATRVRIMLALDASDHFEALTAYGRTLMVSLALGLVTAALLGWWIAHRELRIVTKMAATARSISSSSLGERLALAETPVELHQLVDAFNTMLARLEDSFARLSGFSSDLAHELRTPIHNLMVHSQVALNKARSTDEYRDVLAANVEELERLARLVGDMLFLAKADQAHAVLRKEEFDIRAEFDKVSAFFELIAEERRLRIECEGRAVVRADRKLVERLISNLLSNAIRHGEPDSSIRASIESGESAIRLAVTNRGPGIPATLHGRVFDRFFQADPARSQGDTGAGLGLAISKSIMDLHGGSLSVESAPQGPTTFTACFPHLS